MINCIWIFPSTVKSSNASQRDLKKTWPRKDKKASINLLQWLPTSLGNPVSLPVITPFSKLSQLNTNTIYFYVDTFW